MKRRSFVKSSLLTSALGGLAPLHSWAKGTDAEAKKSRQEFYELRVYTLKTAIQQQLVQDYYEQAAIPALNRLGNKNIGVFTEMTPTGITKIYVLIPYKSITDFSATEEKISKDAVYTSAAAAYLFAPATAPAYDRIESSLFRAFTHMPAIEVPEKKARIFELRRYESSGEGAGKKKIEMFNSAGEIDIFRKVGLTPVFFGEALVGPLRPNLTYMLTYDDMAERSKNWKAFGSDPEWKKISSMPEYLDAKIVSHITATFLVPAAFSQI